MSTFKWPTPTSATSAQVDLEAGYRFHEAQEPGLGSFFVDNLLSEIDSLNLIAVTHRQVEGFYYLRAKRFPFGVFYDIESDRVRVFGIFDIRMNPETLRRQKGERHQ